MRRKHNKYYKIDSPMRGTFGNFYLRKAFSLKEL
jgi:hypothetical protein